MVNSSGVANLSQSWVPLGTKFKMYSPVTIAPSQEAMVRLIVVKKIDPAGYKSNVIGKFYFEAKNQYI